MSTTVKTNTAVKKTEIKEETAVTAPASLAGFTVDEINELPAQTSYLDAFYSVRAAGSQFEIIDKDDQPIKQSPRLDGAIVLYQHWVYSLTRGAVEGATGDRADWSDDMKRTVAKSYGSPFYEPRSRGNFDLNGYGQYLDDAELRKAVTKRLYFYLALAKGTLPAGQVAVASFGTSSNDGFKSIQQTCISAGVPVGAVKVNLSLVPEKSSTGKDYNRVDFKLPVDGNNQLVPAAKTTDLYRSHILPVIQMLRENHLSEVNRVESIQYSDGPTAVYDATPTKTAGIDSMQLDDGELPY